MLLDLVLDGFLCAFSAPLRLCASVVDFDFSHDHPEPSTAAN